MPQTTLLYDRGALSFEVPEGTAILRPPGSTPLADPDAALREALARPIDAPPLAALAAGLPAGGAVVITISDITRPVPNAPIVGAVLGVLHGAGVAAEQITILVATGMHRGSTPAEHVEMLGRPIVGGYRIVDHDSRDPAGVRPLDRPTSAGTRASVNRRYLDADLKIVTGFIEPHFMAGFSGGRKGICPGLVDLATVEHFHGYEFLASPRAAAGVTEGNPCHVEATEVAARAGCDFLVNVTVDTAKRICGVFAGEITAAHRRGIEAVRRDLAVPVERQYDVVFTCGGGYPLDTTFYQTVKGMVIAEPFVRPAGTMVVASGLAQQVGSTAYFDLMQRFDGDWKGFLKHIGASGRTELDQWEFQMQCRVLEKLGVEGLVLVTDGLGDAAARPCCYTPAAALVGAGSPADQLARLVDRFAGRSMAVIPTGPYILPV